MTKWSDLDPIQKQKRIAWSVATSTAIETRGDAVLIYEKIMRDWNAENESNETQISGNS
jgi:hypothetical protein